MVVFFDIDGTLVDDESQIIPESAVRAIAALRENGHVPMINTGRPYSHIDPRVRQLPFSGWVCAGGMEIFLDGHWLQQLCMTPEESRQIVQAVRDCRMQVILEVEGGFLLDGEYSTCSRVVYEAGLMEQRGCFVKQVADCPDTVIMKFVTFDGPDSHRAEFLSRMEPMLHCIDRGRGMVEYVKKGCSKAIGMEQVLRHLGVPREDSFAIGDSTNDLPMFRAAGHAICMGNGMEAAKAEAEFVTASVLENGIEKALQQYGLIP